MRNCVFRIIVLLLLLSFLLGASNKDKKKKDEKAKDKKKKDKDSKEKKDEKKKEKEKKEEEKKDEKERPELGTTVIVAGITFDADEVRVFCFRKSSANEAKLRCEEPYTIWVEYANYGRTSFYRCPSPRGQYETERCNSYAQLYTKHLQEKCNGRRTCKYNYPQPQFGIPCREFRKYLEVQYKCKKCGFQTWGDSCEKTCNCYHGRCHPGTGICWAGECDPGWHGERCNRFCPPRTYGRNCRGRCSKYCLDCNRLTGCTKCVLGRTNLPECQSACAPGRYGWNCTDCGYCLNKEPCKITTGVCPKGCIAGYHQPQCKTPCPSGKWGRNCLHNCGDCAEGKCDPVTGYCDRGCGAWFVTRFCTIDLRTTLGPLLSTVVIIVGALWISCIFYYLRDCCVVATYSYKKRVESILREYKPWKEKIKGRPTHV